MQDKQACAIHKEKYQPLVPSQNWEMTKKGKYIFPEINST